MTLLQYYHITFDTWAAVFCLVAVVVIWPARSLDRASSQSCIALLLTDCILNVAEVCAWACRGVDGEWAFYLVRISKFTVGICANLLLIFMAIHMSSVIITRHGRVNMLMVCITFGLAVFGIAIMAVSQFFDFLYTFDENYIIVRKSGYVVFALVNMLGLIPLFIQTLENRKALRKRELLVFLAMCILPVLGGAAQLILADISTYNVANSVSFILLILVHQYEYTADVIERERLRANEQIDLYTRQIQPHFIYNSLSAIRADLPEGSKAWDSLNHFAGFLRGSIDLLSAEGCIRAEREFKTVEDYLYMEKQRFGEDLNVIYDINDMDFELPPFTVQTMVENAVRHGVRENPDGRGTLELKSYAADEAHIIEVKDDGPGYDINDTNSVTDTDGHKHIGIENVEKRLKLMCNGTLEIFSESEKGTLARIIIPKI